MDVNTVAGGVVQQTQQVAAANQQAANTTGGAVVTQTSGAQQIANMFTQEQVNGFVQARVNEKNNEIAQLQAQLAQAQQNYQTTFAQLTEYKNKDIAVKAGVPSAFVNFAVFEAGKLAVNGKTFEAAMTEFVAANSALFGTSQVNAQTATVQQNNQTTATQQQAGAQQQNTQNTQAAGAQVTQGVAQNTANATVQQAQVTYGGTATGGTVTQQVSQPGAITEADSTAWLKKQGYMKQEVGNGTGHWK